MAPGVGWSSEFQVMSMLKGSFSLCFGGFGQQKQNLSYMEAFENDAFLSCEIAFHQTRICCNFIVFSFPSATSLPHCPFIKNISVTTLLQHYKKTERKQMPVTNDTLKCLTFYSCRTWI